MIEKFKYILCLAVGIGCLLTSSYALSCGAFVPSPFTEGTEDDRTEPEQRRLVHNSEKMLYVDHPGERITVYQGRSFEGKAEAFAWILPVPGEPTVDVAVSDLFYRLKTATQPTFKLKDQSTGRCPSEVRAVRIEEIDEGRRGVATKGSAGDDSPPFERDAEQQFREDDVVERVSKGKTGPYRHTTIRTNPNAANPAERAIRWLRERNYAVENVDLEVLKSYLEKGRNLLAMRLRPNGEAGDIKPVAITYKADMPRSPIRLARAGASKETKMLIWVAGDGRAVPSGYPMIELNLARLDWLSGGKTYDWLVNKAVSESELGGFVTDYARRSGKVEGVFFGEHERDLLRRIRVLRASRDQTIDEQTLSDFYLRRVKPAFIESLMSEETFSTLSSKQLFRRIDSKLSTLRKMEKRLQATEVLTRLYTKMPRRQMTNDVAFPTIEFQSPRPAERIRKRTIHCGSERQSSTTKDGWKKIVTTRAWTVDFPYVTVWGRGEGWPSKYADTPAAAKVQIYDKQGNSAVLKNNYSKIRTRSVLTD